MTETGKLARTVDHRLAAPGPGRASGFSQTPSPMGVSGVGAQRGGFTGLSAGDVSLLEAVELQSSFHFSLDYNH